MTFNPNEIGRCPHPFKKVWVTPLHALQACEHDPGLAPYRCVCGGWHIGHNTRAASIRRRVAHQIRKALQP